MPEYREIRANVGNFLDLCYTPSLASEVTLQPITRFGMDAAIIFSDILVIPHALGIDVRFEEKKGPVLVPVQTVDDLRKLDWNDQILAPVYEALRLTKKSLPEDKALIGFAGSPWTLACYIVQGQSDQKFDHVRDIAKSLMETLTTCVIAHCGKQIEAGAEVIQLFDSWAGVLSDDEFNRWVIAPNKWIVKALQRSYPNVPIIGFPRGAGTKYLSYAVKTGVDGINIDASISLEWARDALGSVCTVQGNLNPILLAEDKDAMLLEAKRIISTLAKTPFIFNLGHGILPHTPIENVQALCELLRNE